MTAKLPTFSIICALIGDRHAIENFLNETWRALNAVHFPQEVEIVLVFDDAYWKNTPLLDTLTRGQRFAVKTCYNEEPLNLPAKLYNCGLRLSTGLYVTFSKPGAPVNELSLIPVYEEISRGERSELLHIAVEQETIKRWQFPHQPTGDLIHTWLLCANFLRPSDVFIPLQKFQAGLRFDESPLLQMATEWALQVRLTSYMEASIQMVSEKMSQSKGYSTHSLRSIYPASIDTEQRYIAKQPWFERLQSQSSDENLFLRDLPKEEREFHHRCIEKFTAVLQKMEEGAPTLAPLKITVTSGFWDYHHNRLCFFNYLDDLAGKGFASYKTVFEHTASLDDFIGCDIVFLSRSRTEKVKDILAWCRLLRIPTVYMLDDNWFTVAADWPEQYGEMFSPTSPAYQNFIAGVEGSDYVLTYNRHLADDISKYNGNILRLPNSVELKNFEKISRPKSERFLIGYSGSPRYTEAPFKALGDIGRSRPDVEILISGTVLPYQEKLLDGCRIVRRPQMSYSRYISDLRSLGIDILLAPLDDSRTSASKCPNKYLEITALGAVGIYSDLDPYRWFIKNKHNGLMIESGAKSSQWERIIRENLDKRELAKLQSVARTDVAVNFDVPVVAEKFLKMIQKISQKNREND